MPDSDNETRQPFLPASRIAVAIGATAGICTSILGIGIIGGSVGFSYYVRGYAEIFASELIGLIIWFWGSRVIGNHGRGGSVRIFFGYFGKGMWSSILVVFSAFLFGLIVITLATA